MSNWLRAKVSTEIKNPTPHLFAKACENMGYVPDYSLKEVHGAYDGERTEPVSCVLRRKSDNSITTIGFTFAKKNDQWILSVSGDFYRSQYSGEQFMRHLGMQYKYEMLKESMEEQGYTIEDVEQKENEVVFIGCRQVA